MNNDDKISPSIILAGQALLVKKLITLETPGIFGSNFVYMYLHEHNVGRSSSFSEDAHNS